MPNLADRGPSLLRSSVYLLLIAISVASMAGRLATVRSALGGTPLLSANDRSRWATVRALVDEGDYAIDRVIFLPDGRRNREWYSIDMVRHPGRDGVEHFYSSKPPLLATVVAGAYFLLQQLTGARLETDAFFAVRWLLVLAQLLPMLAYFWLVCRAADRWATTDWGRIFTVSVATCGTFLTTFIITLNNHLPAAMAAALGGYALLRMAVDGRREVRYFVVAGLGASGAAANELPALLFLVLATAVAFRAAPRRAAWAFGLPVLLVGGAALGTTYLAHGTWRPPYAHRQDGPMLARLTWPAPDSVTSQVVSADLRVALANALRVELSEECRWAPRAVPGTWELSDPRRGRRWACRWTDNQLEVREWDNWYEYPGTYWQASRKKGVDRGEPSRATYAFHVILGHHGVLSLTPVWLLSIWGTLLAFRADHVPYRGAVAMVAGMTLVCLAFYIARPEQDRNYGGVNCGFRWLFWLIPFWLFSLMPAADRLGASVWGQFASAVLLAVGVFSAAYADHNPWSHPWLFDYWTALGWIRY